jgi:hypothetical protein
MRGYKTNLQEQSIDMASITSGKVNDLYCHLLNQKIHFCQLKSCSDYQECNAVVAPTDYASGGLREPNAASTKNQPRKCD